MHSLLSDLIAAFEKNGYRIIPPPSQPPSESSEGEGNPQQQPQPVLTDQQVELAKKLKAKLAGMRKG